MLTPDSFATLITRGQAGGADFVEVYAERWRRRLLRTVDAQVEEAASSLQYGAGIRLFFGTEVVYGYTNDLTDAALGELLENLLAVRVSSPAGTGAPDAAGRGGLDLRRMAPVTSIHAPSLPFEARNKAWRLERLREVEAGARISPEVKQVEARLHEWEQDVSVANSSGVVIDDRRVRTRVVAQVIASNGEGTQSGHAGPGLSVGLELFDKHPPAEVGRQAAEIALVNLHARKAPAGTMPVVIGNAFGGVIFHEALGHLLETTAVARNASALAGKLGEKVASETVTYVDDGTTPHGWGSSRFDDEGAATERTVLIRDGVLESYMVDRWGSLVTGYRPTGSGRREDYTYAPTSRMRNTFVLPGTTPKADLFSGVELGLYAKTMGGGQVMPGSGEYNFAVTEGYMIRGGELAEPVRGAMLVGKGPESIKRIAAVSDDLETAPGMCGSMSGSVPVELGQPHLLISEIIVGGEA